MKRRPNGPKYRNLSARSGAIYYEQRTSSAAG